MSLDERAVKFKGFRYTQPTFSYIISGGKSTLALSFFRFVEATEGKILIDGINIADVGLADLRSRLTIIPRACKHFSIPRCSLKFTCFSHFEEDPTILSGTLRSTLDVFNEYEDVEIVRTLSHGDLTIDLTLKFGVTQFEALHRVHLIPSDDGAASSASEGNQALTSVNVNVFRDLDSPVSEGGDNFSAGEKQLIWWVADPGHLAYTDTIY